MKKEKKARAIHRIRIVTGLINKLEKSVQDDFYCVDTLKQSLAIQNALKSLDALLLENHLQTCVKGKMKPAKETNRLTDELLELYKLSRKNA